MVHEDKERRKRKGPSKPPQDNQKSQPSTSIPFTPVQCPWKDVIVPLVHIIKARQLQLALLCYTTAHLVNQMYSLFGQAWQFYDIGNIVTLAVVLVSPPFMLISFHNEVFHRYLVYISWAILLITAAAYVLIANNRRAVVVWWSCLMCYFGIHSFIGWHRMDDLHTLANILPWIRRSPHNSNNSNNEGEGASGGGARQGTSSLLLLSVMSAVIISCQMTVLCVLMPMMAASEVLSHIRYSTRLSIMNAIFTLLGMFGLSLLVVSYHYHNQMRIECVVNDDTVSQKERQSWTSYVMWRLQTDTYDVEEEDHHERSSVTTATTTPQSQPRFVIGLLYLHCALAVTQALCGLWEGRRGGLVLLALCNIGVVFLYMTPVPAMTRYATSSMNTSLVR